MVTAAGRAITQALASITFETDTLDFNGNALIGDVGTGTDCLSGVNCAGKLGRDDFATKLKKDPAHRNGAWTGAFFLKLIKNMPGAWEGTREPAH